MGDRMKDINKTKIYLNSNYDGLDNFISYFNQYKLICETNPKFILEIGKGTGLLSSYIKSRGYNITTCDFNKDLNPDYVGDIRNLPFKNNEFDTIVAFEVLEHLPFNDFEKAVLELRRVSKNYVIFSVPYRTINFGLYLDFTFFKVKTPILRLMELFFKDFKFDGYHYWEMGKRNYSRKKIRKIILDNSFKIVKEFSSPLNPVHYFFILSKLR